MGHTEAMIEECGRKEKFGVGDLWGEKLPRDDVVTISASRQHMVSFSIIGRLIGTFSIFCLDPNQDVSSGALEALYYLFTILVLQRSEWAAAGWTPAAGPTELVEICIASDVPQSCAL